ncbi:hypothetical protein C8R44DRAFT_873698 [Mycena epipterygia]|nr:hypothetical protein C8R44DRAFT_873698 [Mycena epipterygia]
MAVTIQLSATPCSFFAIMHGLDGSSKDNPWILNYRGRLVLSDPRAVPEEEKENQQGPAKRRDSKHILPSTHAAREQVNVGAGPSRLVPAPRGTREQLNVGPSPSRTMTSARAAHDRVNTGSGPARTVPSTCAARDQVNRSAPRRRPPLVADPNVTPPRDGYPGSNQRPTTSSARTRIRRARVPVVSERPKRDRPLTEEDLWIDGGRPSPLADVKPHHECIICKLVKSHRVSYKCGHSDCYVCIRLWLEKQWWCPHCMQEMNGAPFRHYAEEASIRYDYPDWVDHSKVSYDWEGMVFPEAPRKHLISLPLF